MTMGGLEKITINMAPVDLGHVDLLVAEGFYQNRTDFIRTAIRNQLNRHENEVRNTVSRRELVIGLQVYTSADLQAKRDAGEMLRIRILGMAVVSEDVEVELALATIESVEVLGAFRASRAVKSALADRISSP